MLPAALRTTRHDSRRAGELSLVTIVVSSITGVGCGGVDEGGGGGGGGRGPAMARLARVGGRERCSAAQREIVLELGAFFILQQTVQITVPSCRTPARLTTRPQGTIVHGTDA